MNEQNGRGFQAVVRHAFNENMQDQYFEGVSAELAVVAPRSKLKRFARQDDIAGEVAQDNGPAVVGPSLMVFDEQLSVDDRQNAIDSQTFAEAVVRRLPKGTSNEQRYIEYNDALLATGWTVESFTYKRFVSKKVTLTVNEAVLQVLETVIAGGSGNILSMVSSGFRQLKGDKEGLKVVDIGSQRNQVISFKAVPCIATPGGGMALVLGGLDLIDKKYDGNFLFVSFQSEGVQLFQAAGVRNFNRRMFERKKQKVYDYIDQFGDDLFKKLTSQ
ncbi:hypothetical protein [Pseudomonas fluorescens]|uniref:Uncharacterized protein n=1 Tax=Pseudomonas fluorescens TaxID=294 RepID=A0A5E7E4Z4_PSEFL|nr:hypothetical protein [Pseudomonas fluorescens]VVO21734.1 hypothetical protein PS691_04241 [Pseudomonas fluorescens]